jgi:hypothetical protein
VLIAYCHRSLLYFFSGKAFSCCCVDEDDGPEIEVTYESALLATYGKGVGRRKLAGTPTYRMPHHPRYKDMFDNPMYKPIWFKAFGRLRYTQLVCGSCSMLCLLWGLVSACKSHAPVVLYVSH